MESLLAELPWYTQVMLLLSKVRPIIYVILGVLIAIWMMNVLRNQHTTIEELRAAHNLLREQRKEPQGLGE